MSLALLSFTAWVLTIFAPCAFPLLSVILGGSMAHSRPGHITIMMASLAFSIVAFALLVKGMATFAPISHETWAVISWVILFVVGLSMVFPGAWERAVAMSGFSRQSGAWLCSAREHDGYTGSVLTGIALGPVFTSCSPTYAAVIGSILPVDFSLGTLYITLYALGLVFMLLLVAVFGQTFMRTIRGASDPRGWFRRGVGVFFLAAGIMFSLGFHRDIEAWFTDRGWSETVQLERMLLRGNGLSDTY